ncbi:hypothetical protein D3C71_752620 [compost metagenome]
MEAVPQPVHIVTQLAGRLEEAPIGQEQGPRRIVGQTHPADVARGGDVEGRAVQLMLDQIVEAQQHQLMRHQKGPRRAGQAGVDIEDARRRIEAPHGPAPFAGRQAHPAQVVQRGLQIALGMAAGAQP